MKYRLIVDETTNEYIIESNCLPRVGDSFWLNSTDSKVDDNTDIFYKVRKVTHDVDLNIIGDGEGTGRVSDITDVFIEVDKDCI